MAVVAIFGGGAATGLSALLRLRSQTQLDRSSARKTDAEATEINATAYGKLMALISALTDEMREKDQHHAEEIRLLDERLNSDINAKDRVIRTLHAQIDELKTTNRSLIEQVARLNAENIAREKKYEAQHHFTDGVIQAFAILDGQLRAIHVTPAAQLPPKPDTGPFK